MTAQPGADELRIRTILKQRGVGPDAQPQPTIPPKPAVPPQRARDWLDDILDTPAGPEPEAEEAPREDKPARRPVKFRKVRKPDAPTTTTTTPTGRPLKTPAAFTQRLRTTVEGRLPNGKLLNKQHAARTAYWASAAGAGWLLGAGPWFLACLNFYIGGGFYGTAVLVVLALLILTVDSRTHALRGPGRHPVARAAGWVARIPLASALLAIALYKTR